MTLPLILASASPRRLDLLKQIGLVPDAVDPAELDESVHKGEMPLPYARRVTREKALVVAARHAGKFVLAGDTVVSVGRRILPKGETRADFDTCFKLLPGRRHKVTTALALVTPTGAVFEDVSTATVVFSRLTPAQIEAYYATGEWQGKAGAYGYQGHAAAFIRTTMGNYSTIIGLPLYELSRLLKRGGYHHG